jgi:hypothetical protein
MYLLLTGIPATGKTKIADRLRDRYGFVHLDFEDMPTLFGFWSPDGGLDEHGIRAILDGYDDVVISWGFVVEPQLPAVLRLRDLGFTWVWFDGHREEARTTYVGCGRDLGCWERQMESIKQLLEPRLVQLGPVIFATRDDDGQLRDEDEICRDLLELAHPAG